MADTPASATELIGVLDMGASAIRLSSPKSTPIEHQHHRRSLARRAARPRHVFRRRDPLGDHRCGTGCAGGLPRHDRRYGVHAMRAVATSAVREARNADMFLDRISGAPKSNSRSSTRPKKAVSCILPCANALGGMRRSRRRTLLVEVGGGSTSLTVLRRGEPTRSGVFALDRFGSASSSTSGARPTTSKWRC